jgi:hypothetical protein
MDCIEGIVLIAIPICRRNHRQSVRAGVPIDVQALPPHLRPRVPAKREERVVVASTLRSEEFPMLKNTGLSADTRSTPRACGASLPHAAAEAVD